MFLFSEGDEEVEWFLILLTDATIGIEVCLCDKDTTVKWFGDLPSLQVGQLRHREVNWLARGHTEV